MYSVGHYEQVLRYALMLLFIDVFFNLSTVYTSILVSSQQEVRYVNMKIKWRVRMLSNWYLLQLLLWSKRQVFWIWSMASRGSWPSISPVEVKDQLPSAGEKRWWYVIKVQWVWMIGNGSVCKCARVGVTMQWWTLIYTLLLHIYTWWLSWWVLMVCYYHMWLLLSLFVCTNSVPTGLPSHGEDVTVYVWHKPANLPTPFCSVLVLSLIHIWRCRRDVLCRSRWSPYH